MHWISYALLILNTVPALLFASIHELDSFSDIDKYVDKETWVICDLDNTLMETTRQLGSTQWADYLTKQLIDSGKSHQETLEIESSIWQKVQPHIAVRPVDPSAPDTIQKWQHNKIVVLGLTARDPNEIQYTHDQLHSIKIDLNKGFLKQNRITLLMKKSAIYDKGIIFCSVHNSKGVTLKHFLYKIGYQPKRIVFIDDKWSHVKDLEKAFHGTNIEYIGVRFSRADDRVKAFHPEHAAIQYQALPQFLSDEDASFWYHLAHEEM